ncbi:MAG TPA: PaaI family thioesterase [Acidimicrobiales bacterium]|nr:PaaI family thioesterase [Acidimicrobiales bacterium]
MSGSPDNDPPAAKIRPRVPPSSDLTLGMVCVDKSEPGVTVWRMRAGEEFANPTGVVQGGFLSAFADSAMAASTVTNLEGRKAYAANTELKISFVRAAPIGETYTCTARVIGGGKRVTFVEAEIIDTGGRLVAKASSTYLLTPRE